MTNNNDDAYGQYSLSFCDAFDGSPAYAVRAYVDNDNGSGWAYGIYATVSGSTTGSKYAGYFSGDVYTTGSYLPSDPKLKRNLSDPGNALEKLMAVDVKRFEYNRETYPHMLLPEGEVVGFTAGNIKELFPHLVKQSVQPQPTPEEIADGMPYGTDVAFEAVNYTGLIPYLLKAVQEQNALISALQDQNASLQRQVARISELERQLEKLNEKME
jgi:hypothetical protein